MHSTVFMIFGLGFFLFTIHYVLMDLRHDRRYDDEREEEKYLRRLSEAREFGFGEKDKHTPKTLKG